MGRKWKRPFGTKTGIRIRKKATQKSQGIIGAEERKFKREDTKEIHIKSYIYIYIKIPVKTPVQ